MEMTQVRNTGITDGDVLAPDGLVVFEHARRRASPDSIGRLLRSRDVLSGDTALTFYILSSRAECRP